MTDVHGEGGGLIDVVPPAFTALTQHDSLFYSPSIAGELYTGPVESLQQRVAIGALTNLVHAAYRSSQAAKHSLSWRNFAVGSSALMTNYDTGMMGMMSGFNVKPESGRVGLNIHAEQMAISKGRRAGLNRVVGITVYAEPHDDDANPFHRPTLAPCARCVDMFIDAPEVDNETIVLSTDTTMKVCELYSVGNLTYSGAPRLIEDPFSLETDKDLEVYDRTFKFEAIQAIIQLASD